MAYQCKELAPPDWLGRINCQIWEQVPENTASSLAITREQSFELTLAIASVWLSAWVIKQIADMIKKLS